MYAHIRKVTNRPEKYVEGDKGERARPGSTFELDSRKYLNSSQYAQRNLRAKESSDPLLRYG